ncbi:MAG: hypothetical protein M3T49_09320 [Candidatus Eremiobacteraeota bacterium]|nr:hypothetical protein [Candidatus Eremiobacteraeota bacterium]
MPSSAPLRGRSPTRTNSGGPKPIGARAIALRGLLAGDDVVRELDAQIRSVRPSPADSALATRIAYGTLKMRRALEWSLMPFLRKPLNSLSEPLRWTLLMGAYQLLYLRVPAHSAVDESVRLARAQGHAGTAALANAVLRKLSVDGRTPPDPQSDRSIEALALFASLPDWIAQHLVDRFGWATARQIAAGINGAPRRALRLSLDRLTRAAALEALRRANFDARPSAYGIEECVLIEAAPARSRLIEDWLASGAAAWQSEHSQLAVHLLAPKPGERIFDVCAGRGVKTAQIAARVGPDGCVYALDDDEPRISQLRRTMARRDFDNVLGITADARAPYPRPMPERADAVLLDAPCSALGLLGRRADVRWRKHPTDPARFAAVQRRLLARAAEYVRPGGRLLYVTCSTHPAEDENVIGDFLNGTAQWKPWASDGVASGASLLELGSYLLSVPGVGGGDGFFYAGVQRLADEAR